MSPVDAQDGFLFDDQLQVARLVWNRSELCRCAVSWGMLRLPFVVSFRDSRYAENLGDTALLFSVSQVINLENPPFTHFHTG